VAGDIYSHAAAVTDVLDMQLIQQQVDAGGFTWNSCVKMVRDVMSILNQFNAVKGNSWTQTNAALDDANSNKLSQPGAFCDSLRFILDRTKAIRVEVADSKLRLLRPILVTGNGEYERIAMAQKLHCGKITLSLTHKWLRTTIKEQLETGAVTLANLLSNNAEKQISFKAVLSSGIVSLISGRVAVRPETCPEILLLDSTRLAGMHTQFRMMLLISSITSVVAERLAAVGSTKIPEVLSHISKGLIAGASKCKLSTEIIPIVTKVIEMSAEFTQAGLTSLAEEVLKVIRSPESGMCALFQTRLRNFLIGSLAGKVDLSKNSAAVAFCFDTFKIPKSAYSIAPILFKLSHDLITVLKVNTDAHYSRYNDMISAESAGLVMSRVRINREDPAPLGYRKVSVKEVTSRLQELTNSRSLVGATVIRLLDGRMELIKDNYIQMLDGTLQATSSSWVLGTGTVFGLAQTLVVPLEVAI
jgi:hypothetical protein